MQHHRRRRLPNLNRPPIVSLFSVAHLHPCLTVQLPRPTSIRQFINPVCFKLRIRRYLYGYLPLIGGRFCCFLAFEEVDYAGGEQSEECEGADYAPGNCAGRGVVRRAGFERGRGKRGAGVCA